MSTIRLYVAGPLAAGETIELGDAQGHYLHRVMRRSEGDPIEVFDGKSGGFSAKIAAISKRGARIDVLAKVRALEDRGSRPVLFQAVIKRPRLEWLVEKATELDVAAIVPVRTRHVAASLGRIDRLAAIAVEAAEQCGRLDVPTVAPETPLAEIGGLRRAGRPLLVLDPHAHGAVAGIVADLQGDVDLLVGPEGGLASEDETVLAQMHDVVRGWIAPTILRAETAALAALSACAMAGAARSGERFYSVHETS